MPLKAFLAQSASPTVKRKAVNSMVNHHQMSERHACALVGLSRDSYRHVSQTSALNVELRSKIIQTAHI